MPRKSTISKLPTEIREKLDALIKDGTMTIDELLTEVHGMGAPDVKRTALADYRQKMEQRFSRVRDAQEVARVWVDKLGENPDSPMGTLVAEVLKTVAFRTITDLDDSGETVSPMDLMLLSKALKEVAGAQKSDHEFRIKLREEYRKEMAERAAAAADAAVQEAKASGGAGLTDDAAQRIRDIVFGVVG